MGILPRIHEPRSVARSPAEIFDTLHIRRLLVKLAHRVDGKRFESFAVSTTIGEHV